MCFMPVRHVSRVEDAHGDMNPMVTVHWVRGCTVLPLKQLFPLIKIEYWDPAAGKRHDAHHLKQPNKVTLHDLLSEPKNAWKPAC